MRSYPCLNCRDRLVEVSTPGRKGVALVHLDPASKCPYPVAVLR